MKQIIHFILWYRLLTDKLVLEAIADDKVEPRLFDEDSNRQLWRKGCENNQGYFTLENYEVPKFLTATSEGALEIVSKSDLVILEQINAVPINGEESKVLTYSATSE